MYLEKIKTLVRVAESIELVGVERCEDLEIRGSNKFKEYYPVWCTFRSIEGEVTIVVWAQSEQWDNFTFAEGMLGRLVLIADYGISYIEESENQSCHEKYQELYPLMGDYVDDWDWYEILRTMYGDYVMPSWVQFSNGMNR